MKKFLAMGVLAVVAAAISQEQASAWVNFKAGVGANLGYQSGGNCLLWGAFRNGQPPGPGGAAHGNGDCDVCPPFPFRNGCRDGACEHGAPAYAPAPYAPAPYAPAPHGHGHAPAPAPTYAPAPAYHATPGQTQSRVVPAYQTGAPRYPVNPYYAPYQR